MREEMRQCDASTAGQPASWHIALLLLATLVLRGGLLILWHEHLQEDPDGYQRIAESLVSRGTLGDNVPVARQLPDGAVEVTRTFLPTAYRPPLYPCLLALVKLAPPGFVSTAALLHLAMGLLTVWLTVRIGVRLGLGQKSLVAGALVACDPILLQQSTYVMTETLAALLAVCSIGCLIECSTKNCADHRSSRWVRFAVAGGVLALASLCRPTFLLMLPAAGVWLWFLLPTSPARRRAAIAYIVSAVVVLAPWAARNSQIFGRPIITTTHGGYTFHLANNPGFYNSLRDGQWGAVWKSTDNFRLHAESELILNMTDYPETRLSQPGVFSASAGPALPRDTRQHELLLDRLHHADALAAIRDEPEMFAYSVLVRWSRLWQPLPHRVASEGARDGSMRYGVALWYVAVYVLALRGLWNLRGALLRSPWCWATLLVGIFMAVHALYWTDMRMRAPLVPVICWWAAAGWNCYHPFRSCRKS